MKLPRKDRINTAQPSRDTERRRDEEKPMTRHNGPAITDIKRTVVEEEPPWNGQQKQLLKMPVGSCG